MEKENIIKTNVITEESEIKKNAIRIIKGSLFSILLSLILLLIFALLLTYTELSETTIIPVVLTVVGISILVGSTISTRTIKKNGLLNGGIVGLIYIITLYLASSLCIVRLFSYNLFFYTTSRRNINWYDWWNYWSKL